MPTSLFQYEMLPTTWFYLSALMIIATFFRFNRFWSFRNLDLIGLIAFTPGLLWIAMGDDFKGYLWLHLIGGLMFLRLLFDLFMVRRPLLEPNLASSGLIFSCVMLITFLIPNMLINRGAAIESYRTLRLEQILTIKSEMAKEKNPEQNRTPLPGYRPFFVLTERINKIFIPPPKIRDEVISDESFRSVSFSKLTGDAQTDHARRSDQSIRRSEFFLEGEISEKFAALAEPNENGTSATPLEATPVPTLADESNAAPNAAAAAGNKAPDVQAFNLLISQEEDKNIEKQAATPLLDEVLLTLFVIMAQFGIVLGMIAVGHCHFGNLKTGIAAAMLYLLLPYVNQMTGRIDHALPGMLRVLAVAIYRRPVFSGFLVGLAGSLVFYPFFLLPLWISFYWKRGAHRFIIGVVSAVLMMGLLLLFSPPELGSYAEQIAGMFGLHSMIVHDPVGLWSFFPTYYRIPVIALFFVVSFGLILWPTQKNLATLISCSAMLMLGVQFWQGDSGGLYMGWYLPLLILTFFRPNLEDRVAAVTVVEV